MHERSGVPMHAPRWSLYEDSGPVCALPGVHPIVRAVLCLQDYVPPRSKWK